MGTLLSCGHMGAEVEDPMLVVEACYRLRLTEMKKLVRRAASRRVRRMLVELAEEEAVSVPNVSR